MVKLPLYYIKILATLSILLTAGPAIADVKVFVLEDEALQTLPHRFMTFAEGLDENATIINLENAKWNSLLQTPQSFVDGYWGRILISNMTSTSSVGLNHNWNREKKIFVRSKKGIIEYKYWNGTTDPALGEGRILSQYKIEVPTGEQAVIYSFFRSKPFDRFYGSVDGLDRVTLGSWENVRFRENFRLSSNIIFLSVSIAFGFYYLFIYLVSGGNNLWLSLSIFMAALSVLITQSSGLYLGVPRWISNSEISFCFFALLFVLLIQFFRKSLEIKKRYPVVDKLFVGIALLYCLSIIMNFFTGVGWPREEQFDLVNYPPDYLGPGILKLQYLVLPFLLTLMISIGVSVIGWTKGNKTDKYMFVSFMLPFIAVPITISAYFILGFTWLTMLIGSTSVGLLFLCMFISFGLAVAQQINDLRLFSLMQQVRLTEAYQRFVPHQLLHHLKKESILDVSLGDQAHLEMSIMFSDIRSFTSMSEKMSPEENFRFVNSYLNEMGPIVRLHNGYIDKFIGDGIMALFPNSAVDAVNSAVKMQHRVMEFNNKNIFHPEHDICIGVGINTGLMMLGTIGEADRMEGSVISDAVNLASRLEELTKLYQAKVLISEETLAHLRDTSYVTRLVDRVAVKGKSAAVDVYEVLDAEMPFIFDHKQRTLSAFNEGVQLYQKKKMGDALQMFEACLDPKAIDGAVDCYINRCKAWLSEGPPKGVWDGIHRMDTK